MRNTNLIALALALRVLPALGQDSTARSSSTPPDSATLDTMLNGPPYAFTGNEDPTLLAAAFQRTYQLADKPEGGTLVCLGLGRGHPADPPLAVLRAFTSDTLAAHPPSQCKLGREFYRRNPTDPPTGPRTWIMTITSLGHAHGDTIVVYSSYAAGPLWGAGFACTARRERHTWVVGSCVKRWVS